MLIDHHCHLLLGAVPSLQERSSLRKQLPLCQELATWGQATATYPQLWLESSPPDLPLIKQELLQNAAVAKLLSSYIQSPVASFYLSTVSWYDALANLICLRWHPLWQEENQGTPQEDALALPAVAPHLKELAPALSGGAPALSGVAPALSGGAPALSQTPTNPRFTLALGIHPYFAYPSCLEDELPGLLALASLIRTIWPQLWGGWGEIGLDRRLSSFTLTEQQALLKSMMMALHEAAPQAPFTFHCVGAYPELVILLTKSSYFTDLPHSTVATATISSATTSARLPNLVGREGQRSCLHGFNGKAHLAYPIAALGLSLGLGKALLSQANESKWRQLFTNLVPDSFTLESDCDGESYPGELIGCLQERYRYLAYPR